MKALLRSLTLIAALGLCLASVHAADAPATKPQKLTSADTQKADMKQFTAGFLYQSSVHVVGKLSIPAFEKSPDLGKLITSLDGSQWNVHCMLIDKSAEPGVQTTFILAPKTAAGEIGMITITGLTLNDPGLQIVNSHVGYPATLVYQNHVLKLMLGGKESFDIVTKSDLEKAHAALKKPGANGLVSVQ